MIGTMAVANREGDVATFDRENLKLFETLANHAAMSLENHELIDQLQWEATHDTLTGLGNRREFYRALATALDERPSGGRIAVALVDLDRFKEINDTFGHHTGDTFLQWLGQRFKELLPPEAQAARLGGDEFAVFIPYEGEADLAVGVIQRILHPLWEAAFEIGDVKAAVSASTGVAVAPDHAEDPITLLQRADVAMYLAKGDRSGVAGYTTERDTYSPRRVGLASALRTAIELGELKVFFQPQLDLTTQRISGAEALVRWQHPREGLLLPDQFIPLAERTGLIIPLTDVVLRQALGQCADWQHQLEGADVAVNLSIGNLTNNTVVTSVTELLRQYDVTPESLILEVTESQIMEDEARHVAVLEALADIGVKISVDDFGTGYSSFAYLTRLPVHQVKIDKSFVGLMDRSPNNAAVVRSVIELGRDLGITVVAEGVESEANLQALRRLGCTVAQGYYIGIPMPSAEFKAMALEWNDTKQISVEVGETPTSTQGDVRTWRVRI
jgi:diguanylate cyclase (GGDEF)-like protein